MMKLAAPAAESLAEDASEILIEGFEDVEGTSLPQMSMELQTILENMTDQIGEFSYLNSLPEEIGEFDVYARESVQEQDFLLASDSTESDLAQEIELYQKILDQETDIPPDKRQSYQEKIDTCKSTMEQMKNGEELTRAQKGNLGEMLMDLEYLKNGFIRIGDMGITDLNQSGHNGIDGVYQNSNPPPNYIIADAKYGSSQLNKDTNDGPQMSENWIDKRLDAAVGKDKADEIRLEKLLDPDSVQSQLVKISPTGDIQILSIDIAGNIQKGGNGNA